jgi:hypothetical protein
METLVVTLVTPYSPGDESADVTLRSERGEIVVFCYPCSLREGDTVPNRLSVLDGDVRAAYLSDWSDDAKMASSVERLERIGVTYGYRGAGQVIDQAEGLVEVFGFVIDFGEVPCDGSVEFEIERLDVRTI